MSHLRPTVERNDDVELTISALGSEGQGIGRIDGYALFVPGALPGEQVRAHVIKAGSGYGVGKLMKVLESAPEREYPRCPQFGRCGGCTLQHLAYESQLSYKRQQVQDALIRLGGFADVAVEETLGMEEEPWQYRNKGSFPFGVVKGRVEAGFFAPRSHRLIPAPDCLIQQPVAVILAQVVREWAEEFDIPVYQEETSKGLLRHVMTRVSTNGEAMAVIVATGSLPKQKALIEALRDRVDGIASIYLNINPDRTNVIFGREFRLLWGKERITQVLCGLEFSISPASFLQVNSAQTKRLYETALSYLELKGDEKVVDAYCGIGTISLLLATKAGEVLGIDDVPPAVEDAKANAIRNGIGNVRFVCAPAETALPALIKEGFQPDAIVADPPRKGCDPAFLQAVIHSNVKKMVYISCNPATLARDCAILRDGGFGIARVQPVDLFPQTTHVETVVLMLRNI